MEDCLFFPIPKKISLEVLRQKKLYRALLVHYKFQIIQNLFHYQILLFKLYFNIYKYINFRKHLEVLIYFKLIHILHKLHQYLPHGIIPLFFPYPAQLFLPTHLYFMTYSIIKFFNLEVIL